MIINYNAMASNSLRQLNINQTAQSKSMAKLSSGLRINNAADDAAGLAISEKMKGQIRGLNQASRNAQDGQSLVQTAEGALSQTTDILQRMRELATQSSNDTNTADDRNAMQIEVGQLSSEINRISTTTQFNTKNLLDGSIGNNANIGPANNLNLKNVQVVDSNLKADTYTVTNTTAAAIGIDTTSNTTGYSSTGSDFDMSAGNIAGLKLGDYTLTTSATATAGHFDYSLKDSNGNVVASAANQDPTAVGGLTLSGNLTDGTATTFTLKAVAANTIQTGSMSFNLNATYGTAGDFNITDTNGNTTYSSATNTKITGQNFQAGGLQFDMSVDTALSTAGNTSTVTTINNALTMQIGANQGQTMQVDINKMDTNSLGIGNIDLTTQKGAETAITSIDNAIKSVSAERAKLGAYSNRLDNTINNLNTSSQNTSDAQARIADVDMAAEMMNQSKSSVLAQAAQAMLAQANQQPQQVLQLLRG